MHARTILLALLTVLCASAAEARTRGPTRRDLEQHACYNDAMRLCKEFVPDEAKITACMKAKKAQLSAGCAAMFGSKTR